MARKITANRRDFIKTTAGVSTFTVLSSSILHGANAPSEQFRFAQVGCGGKGSSDLKYTVGSGAKLAAMCDVDKKSAKRHLKKYGDKVPFYSDYRVMFDKHEKEFDGVVISTPDHTHACIALEAIKRGKHVYVQKPLARTFQECEVLLAAAKKHKVVTQMGNQGHAGNGLKLWQKMMDDKAFGDIQHVNSWSNRPIWPQGMTKAPNPTTAPDHLSWDQWIGPVAEREYCKEYLPFSWRGWWDFGCGAMGDMAVHNLDPAFWILQLGLPKKIKAQASAPATVAYPKWSIIDYTFESKVTGKEVTVTWYDGKKLPKMPDGCNPSLKPGGNGCMVIGSKMAAMGGSHAARPLPISITGKEYSKDGVKAAEKYWRDESKKLKSDNHHKQWVDAAKAGDLKACGSKFEYSVPFVQSLLLGCIALRFPGEELIWDDNKKQFNHSDANKWLSFQPRKGYSLTL